MHNNIDESALKLSVLSNVDYSMVINICKFTPLTTKNLLDFYLLTARFPTIQEFDYACRFGFSLLITLHTMTRRACQRSLPSKTSMYVDIDSNAHISLYGMTADEAMRLSLMIDSAGKDLLTGPLKSIGNQLYLYANKSFSQIYEESNKTLNIGDK